MPGTSGGHADVEAGGAPRARRVLVVAYYFPPMGLSGVQRVAKLVKYLPAHGWLPTVLTVEPAGYFAYDATLLREVEAAGVEIVRTPSWDPTRLFGRRRIVSLPSEPRRRLLSLASQFLFVPDNKIGWYPFAVRAGRRLLRRRCFDAILSSAPPYSAHLVARTLSRESGLPLVTDFRDAWVENPRHVYPTPLHRRMNAWLERRVLQASRQVLTINDPIRDGLLRRMPAGVADTRVQLLYQGYDPQDFDGVPLPVPEGDGRMRLVYSGVFYDVQTPDYFLRALAELFERRPEARAEIEAVFVGLVPDASKRLAASLGLDGTIRCAGYVPHDEAVAYLLGADVLWMTVGERAGAEGISTSKLFEYMGARRPILALVPEGAVRQALAPYGAARVVAPADVPAIRAALEAWWEAWREGRLPVPDEAYVRAFDRRRLAGVCARLLDDAVIAP